MRPTALERNIYVGGRPGVKFLPDNKSRCEAWRSGTPWKLRTALSANAGEASGLQEKWRCKRRAVFKFKAFKPNSAKDGMYCFDHLCREMEWPEEQERSQRHIKRHPMPWWKELA